MRLTCQFAVVATTLAVMLLLPSTAAAQIDQLSLSPDVQLGPEGAFATSVVTFQCSGGDTGSLTVEIVQNTGGSRLARGSGGVPVTCTGEMQEVTVPLSFSIFALKQGKAVATATLTVFNTTTFEMFTATTGPVPVRVRK
jgi:hypothetical protein